jgi:ATP-dependent DNA ligase
MGNLEGIVSKRIGSRYVSGRTRAWLKTKNPHFERRQGVGHWRRPSSHQLVP